MSHAVNDELLERLYDEALDEVRPLCFNPEELEFKAECLAMKRFEDMCY